MARRIEHFGGRSSTARSRESAGQRPDGGMRWPAAVLWDMDGTLVDTEPYWIDAEFALAEKYGGTLEPSEHALNLVGNDLLDSGRYIREHMGDRPRARARSSRSCSTAWSRRSARRCRGGRARVELLAALRAAGVPCALVTMSYRRFVAPILAALPAGHLPRGGHRRRGRPRQATPRAVPHRRRGARRRPGRLPRDRGLQHRRPLRRGRRLHRARACPTTCRCYRGSGASSATRSLASPLPTSLPCVPGATRRQRLRVSS